MTIIATIGLLLAGMASAGHDQALQLEQEALTGANCFGDPEPGTRLSQSIGSGLNPLGLQHALTLTRCYPLFKKPGLLFDYSNVSFGLRNATTPSYTQQLAFASITPLSFVTFGARAGAVYTWPFFLVDGTGHLPFDDYHDDHSGETRDAMDATRAGGWHVDIRMTLQAQVDLGPGKLGMVNTVTAEYWQVGQDEFYFSSFHDLVMARQDQIFTNFLIVAYQMDISPDLELTVALADEMNWLPEAETVANKVSLLLAGDFKRPSGAMTNVNPLLLLGYYTHHAERSNSLFAIVGVGFGYDF